MVLAEIYGLAGESRVGFLLLTVFDRFWRVIVGSFGGRFTVWRGGHGLDFSLV